MLPADPGRRPGRRGQACPGLRLVRGFAGHRVVRRRRRTGRWASRWSICGSSRQSRLVLGEVRAAHGRAAVAAAGAAVKAALDGAVEAVVACPQTELAIQQAGIAFDGYPSFVAQCTGTPIEDAFLMLCFDDKRIVHTTLHVGLLRAISLVDVRPGEARACDGGRRVETAGRGAAADRRLRP